MGLQASAPPGYNSNYEFFVALMDFGYSIWGTTGMAVIHYHISRSMRYGKLSDQHSRAAAMGLTTTLDRATGKMKLVRGPAGMGNGTWISENAALLIHPDRPQIVEYVDVFREKTGSDGVIRQVYQYSKPAERPRVLRREGRFHPKHGGRAPSEYTVDSLAIRAAIEEYCEAQKVAQLAPLFEGTSSNPLSGHRSTPRAATDQPLIGGRSRVERPPLRGGGANAGMDISNRGNARAPARLVDLLASDLVSKSETDRPTELTWEEEKHNASILSVREAIEAALGSLLPANNPVPGQVWQIATKLGVPAVALCRFLAEKALEKYNAGYPMTGPKLFVAIAGEKLIPWARANHVFVEQCRREEYQEYMAQRWSRPGVSAMPSNPVFTICEVCGQEAVFDGVCDSQECFTRRQRERAQGSRVAHG